MGERVCSVIAFRATTRLDNGGGFESWAETGEEFPFSLESTSTAALTFSLGWIARSSAPSLCSPRCSSRRCPARSAACFADSEAWSQEASPCCPPRLPPPPRWRPCNHRRPPSRIPSHLTTGPNHRQNRHGWISPGKALRDFLPRSTQLLPTTAPATITSRPPFWRTPRTALDRSPEILYSKLEPLCLPDYPPREYRWGLTWRRIWMDSSKTVLIEMPEKADAGAPFPERRAGGAVSKLSPELLLSVYSIRRITLAHTFLGFFATKARARGAASSGLWITVRSKGIPLLTRFPWQRC